MATILALVAATAAAALATSLRIVKDYERARIRLQGDGGDG